jgi:hypothetical protein
VTALNLDFKDMFGTIRRHQTWLWVIVASLTIISFVIFGPTNTKLGNALSSKDTGNLGTINGKVIDPTEFVNAEREVYLRYFLGNNSQWPDNDPNAVKNGFNVDRETYFRLMLIAKQKEFGIKVSTEAVADMARQILGTLPFDTFEEKVLKPKGMTGNDFERFLRHDLGMQQLFSVAGLSGKLVTPQEAEELYRKEHQELNTMVASFPASNYLASVKVTPEALTNYYNMAQATYHIPDRVQVDYVKYNVTNFLAQAQTQITNLNAMVENEARRYGTNLVPMVGKTTEEANARIREEILRNGALVIARRAANEFALKLDAMEPKNPNNLATLATTNGLTAKTTAPFDQQEGPQDLIVPQTFAKQAFSLTPNEPFSGPVVAEDGVYVLALKHMLPNAQPPLKDVEAKVTEDYREFMAAQFAYQAGMNFANSLTNGLPAGKSFAGVAADAKAKTETLPPFSLSTQSLPGDIENRLDIRALKQAAFSTPVGKVSPFVRTREGGLVLYVQSQIPLDEAQVKKELPAFVTMVRQARQSDAFNQWFNAQIQQDAGFRQKLQQVMENAQRTRSPVRSRTS